MYWWEQQKLPEFLSTIVAELVLATVAGFFFKFSSSDIGQMCTSSTVKNKNYLHYTVCFLRD